jgi:hypothetical protein
MSKKFTKQQREVLARKLGYDGPMNMFDQFVKSDPAMERKYSTVVEKYMARGGMVKKYQEGGVVQSTTSTNTTIDPYRKELDAYINLRKEYDNLANPLKQEEATLFSEQGYWDLRKTLEPKVTEQFNKMLQENSAYQSYIKAANQIQSNVSLLENAKKKALETGQVQSVQFEETDGVTRWNLLIEPPGKESGYDQRREYHAKGISPVDVGWVDQYQKEQTSTAQYWQKYATYAGLTDIAGSKGIQFLANNKPFEEQIPIYQKALLDNIGHEEALNFRERRGSELEGRLNDLEETYGPRMDKLIENVPVYLDEIKNYISTGVPSSFPSTGDQTQQALTQTPTGGTAPTTTQTTPTTTGGTGTPIVGDTSPTTAPTTTPTVGGTTPTTTGTTPITTPTVGGTTPTTTPTVGGTTPTPETSATGTTGTGTIPSTGGMTTTQVEGIPTTSTVPQVNIPQVTAATIPIEPGQMVTSTGAPEQAAQIQGAVVPGVAQVTPTAPQEAATMEATTATGAVSAELAGLQPAQGAVSEQALVKPETMEPTSTALKDLEAAQGVAGQVTGAPTRELVAGELVEGPTVDRAAVEATLAKNEAAQGVVTEDMTVQGQLAKLTANFEANNPPAWAAGALRNATAVLAQRGLAASSLAGQALIQATIESALPIASADAQIYREMGIQNLTNKQQMAVLSAQQRAAFLGQEFDQAFQTRVTNAATISEIANLNFSAKQQIALENARLAESVNLANLNNRQALVMANAAQIATLETANLNNRQQANVLNAQAFLQMDLTNLSNRQQTALFKSQAMIQSILSDQAAENAAKQFNAASVNQVNQFYDGLTAQIKQFNATQANAMNQFNVSQINAVSEFNATQQNARDQFNADYRRIIDQSNAEWRRNIALADTAAINRANEVNANAALGITTIEYNNLWQTYRDQIEYAWKTGENALDRENELARQVLAKQATIEAAKFQIEAAKYQALGGLAAQIFDKGGVAAGIGSFLGSAAGATSSIISGAVSGINNLLYGVNRNVNFIETTGPNVGWTYYSNGMDSVGIDTNGSVYYNNILVADDQLAYTGFTPPSGEINWDLWSGGG